MKRQEEQEAQRNLEALREAQEKPFKYAVFAGGGAKGIMYSGAHEAISRAKIISGLEAVAGSSAGSITSVAIATGISIEKYHEFTSKTDFSKLLGKGFVVNKDGEPLLELIRETIRSNINDYLAGKTKEDISNLCKQRLKSIEGQEQIITSSKAADREIQLAELERQKQDLMDMLSDPKKVLSLQQRAAAADGTFSFRDLSLLRALDPEKFKHLIITAVRRDTGELAIFDTVNTPDVEIALACRASCSIPLVFKPVEIGGLEYVDGACVDNIPMQYFDRLNTSKKIHGRELVQDARDKGRILVLAFGAGMESEENIAIYSSREKIVNPSKLTKFLIDVVLKCLSKVKDIDYFKSNQQTYEYLRENAQNAIILGTEKIGVLSLNLSKEQQRYLVLKGKLQTSKFLVLNDIARNPDPYLDLKEFMLSVYQEAQPKNKIAAIRDSLSPSKALKNLKLLDLVEDERFPQKDKNPAKLSEILQEFIAFAATDRMSASTKTNTRTMKALIKLLNKNTTSDTVKWEFVRLLGINNKDKRLSGETSIVKFKFTEKDFKSYIKKAELKPVKEVTSAYIVQKALDPKRNMDRIGALVGGGPAKKVDVSLGK